MSFPIYTGAVGQTAYPNTTTYTYNYNEQELKAFTAQGSIAAVNYSTNSTVTFSAPTVVSSTVTTLSYGSYTTLFLNPGDCEYPNPTLHTEPHTVYINSNFPWASQTV
jgi:hypothetical protein